ncbi:MAG: biotin transporter BioY [Corynebacterium aurimucosum]
MKKNSVAADIAYVAVFTALIIVFAFVSIPTPTAGVPIVLQNAVIILAGLVLGGRRGLFVGLLFIALGLVGLPILAGGRSALSAIAGPTVGYLVGYVVAPAITGLIAYRAPRGKGGMTAILAIAGLVGLAVQYFCGSLGLMFRSDMSFGAAIIAQGPFIIPDLIKVAVMVIIAVGVHAAFPDLMGRRAQAK